MNGQCPCGKHIHLRAEKGTENSDFWVVPQRPGFGGVYLLSKDPLFSSTVRRVGGGCFGGGLRKVAYCYYLEGELSWSGYLPSSLPF